MIKKYLLQICEFILALIFKFPLVANKTTYKLPLFLYFQYFNKGKEIKEKFDTKRVLTKIRVKKERTFAEINP
ncbi:MAG: hypothetical protein LBT56_00995 [Prevotellaceae bacterium]|jgi:hypothetical protein|nr:hypothetical protein [Prevotellaceae bacterium]